MNTTALYVGFWAPTPLRSIRSLADLWMAAGHVEAWGVTEQGTWWFFDPWGNGTRFHVDHRHDEVEERLTQKFALCSLILKMRPFHGGIRVPLHPPMTCASQVGALVGVRAWSPWALRRKLLAHGAEVIHDANERPQGGSCGQGCAGA